MKVKVLGVNPVRISVEGRNGELILNEEQLAKILAKGEPLGYLDNE